MNEYKVQLESREDLIFLKNEMMKYFDEKCNGTVNEASKQQVSNTIMYTAHSISFYSTLKRSFL